MYLAKIGTSGSITYQLRNSCRLNNNQFRYQIVFDLGPDPQKHFEIYEGYIVLFNSQLLSAVNTQTNGDAELELEKLLWRFLPEETRRRMARFQGRNAPLSQKLSTKEKEAIAEQIHLFDRRRLYYLRYGAVDQSRLTKLHEKCCRPLINMCRDEKEFYFMAEEMALEPGMFLQYIYAIFNLQKYYSESFAPWLPESLAKQELEEHLVEELCCLNDDKLFWAGEESDSFLHRHLRRYLIMFFDFSPAPRTFFNEFARQFISDHRRFRWPENQAKASPEQMSDIFGTEYQELKEMDKEQLSKLFRQKAMKLHPDRGGDHEEFIKLSESYNALLVKKR